MFDFNSPKGDRRPRRSGRFRHPFESSVAFVISSLFLTLTQVPMAIV